jgi:hypothetical protein
MLKTEVVEAVKTGQFHIYQVADVTEGIHILTGVAAGSPDEEGRYPPDSVYGRIQAKLAHFLARARALKQTEEI